LYLKIISAHIIFCLICFSYGSSFAQNILSNNGNFKIDYIKGCAPLQVRVVNNYVGQIDGIDSYNFNYNPNQPDVGFVAEKIHVYSQPGVYVVAQAFTILVDGLKVGVRDFITVEVFPPTAPDFIVIPCSNHRVTVQIKEDIYDLYRIYFTQNDYLFNIYQEINTGDIPPVHQYPGSTNDFIRVQGLFDEKGISANCGSTTINNFSTIGQINPPIIRGVEVLKADKDVGEVRLTIEHQEHVYYQLEYAEGNSGNFEVYKVFKNNAKPLVDNLDTENKYYCFRITPVDGCNVGLNSSNILCNLKLDATAANNQNVLSWATANSTSALLSYFDVYLDNDQIGDATHPATSFTDSKDIECSKEYCYQIRASNGIMYSYSVVKCIEGNKIYTPPGIEDALATFDNHGGIDLTWPPPTGVDVAEYTVLRADNGQTWKSVNPTLQVETGGMPVCYQISYTDECGNQSDNGTMICPVFLTEVPEDGLNKIVWTNYMGWANGIDHYILEKRDPDGILIEQIQLPAFVNEYVEPAGHDNQVVYYQILAVTNDLQPHHLYSNQIKVVYTGSFYFPNAFTPDGDTINDTFKVIGHFFKEYELAIYNRWGELVFTTTNPAEGWDGTYRNKEAPQGTYVYSAAIVDSEGNKYQRKGTVHLLRKR
jgi:gliding motility-associated-like protein